MSEKISQRDAMFRNGNLVEPELQDGILAKPTFDNDQIPNFSYLEGWIDNHQAEVGPCLSTPNAATTLAGGAAGGGSTAASGARRPSSTEGEEAYRWPKVGRA